MMLSIIIPTYDESQNILNLPTPIYPKVKPESTMGQLVVDDNSPDDTRRAVQEAHAMYIRSLPSMTTTAVKTTIHDYESENDSRSEGIINKNYSIKVTHRMARYGLIFAFLLGDNRKFVLFFSTPARSCTIGSSSLLIKSFMSYSLENGLLANISCIYATLVGMICQIRSNLSLNKIWVPGKICGGKRLLQFKSPF